MFFLNIREINEKIGIGNRFAPHNRPSYVKYRVTAGPNGAHVFNPLPLSQLASTLAVANAEPSQVQR